MGDFFDLPPELMTAVATVLGFALLGGLTYNQQNSLGNFLMLIGQILEMSSAQKQLLTANQPSQAVLQLQRQMADLQKQIDELRNLIQPPPQ